MSARAQDAVPNRDAQCDSLLFGFRQQLYRSSDYLRDAYLRLRGIEYWGNGMIYRLLGVPLFKRYVPTSGDLVCRWRGQRLLPAGGYSALKGLRRYEQRARVIEWRHLGGFLAMAAGIQLTSSVLDSVTVTLLWVFNLLVNLYPILLQRYNRLRIELVLRRVAH